VKPERFPSVHRLIPCQRSEGDRSKHVAEAPSPIAPRRCRAGRDPHRATAQGRHAAAAARGVLLSNPNGSATRSSSSCTTRAERLRVTMRQDPQVRRQMLRRLLRHQADDRRPLTGERVEVELFVAVMGRVELHLRERRRPSESADWIASHVRLIEFLGRRARGGSFPISSRRGVVVASRYEPGSSAPTRSGRPLLDDDLAGAFRSNLETGEGRGRRSHRTALILARLRNITWLLARPRSRAHRAAVADLNGRVMKRYGKSRRQLFEESIAPSSPRCRAIDSFTATGRGRRSSSTTTALADRYNAGDPPPGGQHADSGQRLYALELYMHRLDIEWRHVLRCRRLRPPLHDRLARRRPAGQLPAARASSRPTRSCTSGAPQS